MIGAVRRNRGLALQASEGNTAKWARVKEVFGRAVSLDGTARDACVQSECAGDASLRAAVEKLLEQHDRDTELLETRTNYPRNRDTGRAPPSVIGNRFEIVRQLGAGGMGEVYEARDRELGGQVALKMVRPDLVSDPRVRDRFRREILNGRRVTHPNVCRIHDLVSDKSSGTDSLCFTMELLAGETLADMLEREGPLPTERALPLAREMAAGLDALHESGIIHRDFKPANVMLADDNGRGRRVKLTDFGLARYDAAPGEGGLTSMSGSKDIIGTPIYMAPEQLVPEKDKIGPATDVYAFGLVLYEMVTGERPFAAKSYPQNLVAKTMQQPTPPRTHVPDLDEKWNTTILACLASEPDQRPQNPTSALEMLEGHIEPPKPRRKRVSHRVWAAVAAAVVIILAVLTLFERLPFIGGPETIQVAILPFTVTGDDPEFTAFADGLMRRITMRLTEYEGINGNLIVMDASTVLRREVADSADANRKLNINRAVLGDLEDLGGRVELTLAVVDAENGRQLEAVTVPGSRENEPDMRNRAVQELANVLSLQILPEHLDSQTSATQAELRAEDYYTTGLGYLEDRYRTGDIQNAITQFDRAIERDGQFALAHAGLCDAELRMYNRTMDPQYLNEARASCA